MKKLISTLVLLFVIISITNAQWTECDGIYGGDVRSLAILGSNTFAGTWKHGIYVSSNNGGNWSFAGIPNEYIFALATLGTNIFAGTNYGGVYISTDNGSNWIQTALNNKPVLSIATSGSNIFAGTNANGVYLSTDNGNTWSQTSLITNLPVISLAVLGTNIFAGMQDSGVYRSTNNGLNWTHTTLNNKYAYSLAVNGSNIFAGTNASGVYISTNYGVNWSQTSLNNKSVSSLIVSGSNIYAGTGGFGVYLSTNNGVNWNQTGLTELNNDNISCFAINGSNIFAGTSIDGVYRSTNSGVNWAQTTLSSRTVTSLATNGNNYFAGTYNGIYRSTNSGISWSFCGLSDFEINSIAISGNNIFVGTDGDGGIFLSTNNGMNWTQTTFGPNQSVMSIVFKETNIFAGTGTNGVYLSSNNGGIWIQNGLINRIVYSLAVSGSNIFAGCSAGNGVYLSSNNGGSWVSTNLTKPVFSLAVSGSNIFAGTYSFGVYLSTNNGTNWNQTALNNLIVRSLVSYGNYIFAGTDSYLSDSGGVKLSTNNGTSWSDINQGFKGIQSIYSILISNNYIFAGTQSSLWRRPLSDILGPSAPLLYLPSNNSIGQTLPLGLVWNKPSSAIGYNVVISTDSLFTNVVVNDSALTDSIKVLNNLNPLTKYYWKVRAKNNVSWGGFSNIYNFKTLGVPNTVVLSTPANNSINQTTTIICKWLKTAEQTLMFSNNIRKKESIQLDKNLNIQNYWFEYSMDSTFTTVIARDSILTDTTKTISGLNNSTKYYWRVKAKNQIGWGGFSNVWNFTTIVAIPVAPNLVAPLNNAINQQPNVLLDWDSLSSANSYRIQLSTDSLFNSTVYDTNGVTQSSLRMRSGILYAGVKYFWRVNATNIAGTGNWSLKWNFIINPTGMYLYSTEIPKEFKLYNNYPNPFNPSTKIRFDLPKSSYTKITIYDISGREIKQLINEHLTAGGYEITWTANNLASGVYFYHIETENFTDTKRMLLIK